MVRLKAVFFVFFLFSVSVAQATEDSLKRSDDSNIVTTDITNFWIAYDKIVATSDTAQQMDLLMDLFINKGTKGLRTIMEVRRYQPEEYLSAIQQYPLFWESVRESMQNLDQYASDIQSGIDAFKGIYPEMKPAKVYFEIGVFRTPGTALGDVLIIGSEMALTDEKTYMDEFPESLEYFKNYAKLNPVKDVVFLNVHEFVHTQQNVSWAYDLLSQSIFEGSAEFIAEIATGQKSIQPCIEFGQKNNEKVRKGFIKEMFSPYYYNWIWNDDNNDFGIRDLGYYMGYAIVKQHYENAKDKERAIKEIIELDFERPKAIEKFVERTGYFENKLKTYKSEYEETRPFVTGMSHQLHKKKNVKPGDLELIVYFSEVMDTRFGGTHLGPLGEEHFPEITKMEFAEDGRSIKYFLNLEPNKKYQMILSEGYRTEDAIPLVSEKVFFSTGEITP